MMFFNRRAGESVAINEEEAAILVQDRESVPEVVRAPQEIGGQVLKVVRAFVAPCPVTGVDCRHLELEDGYFVAESNMFHWYRRSNDTINGSSDKIEHDAHRAN